MPNLKNKLFGKSRKRKSSAVYTFPGLGVTTIFFFVFLYLPILLVIVYSFNDSRIATVWEGFSLRWYAIALNNAGIQRAIINSFIVAIVVAPLATITATLAAMVMIRGKSFQGQVWLNAIITLPLMIPEIVTAIATLTFFSFLSLHWGLVNVMIAHTVFCIPFAFMPIRATLEAMDPSLELVAQDLYADSWQAFKKITLPLLFPGILSGFMLAFVISLDDFVITLMVASAGATTLPVYIFSMLRVGVTPEVNAVSTLLLSVSILLVTGYTLLSRKLIQNQKII